MIVFLSDEQNKTPGLRRSLAKHRALDSTISGRYADAKISNVDLHGYSHWKFGIEREDDLTLASAAFQFHSFSHQSRQETAAVAANGIALLRYARF
jgi:hypothetical protein